MKKLSQKQWAVFLSILAILTGIILFSGAHDLLWYWIFGLGFGWILQRSHLCFVSATSDPFIMNSTDQFRSILIGILFASVGTSAFKFLYGNTYNMQGVSAISIPLVFGAFIFGIGMVLAGCCSSGMFIRIGEGYLIHLITFICVMSGYFFASTHYQLLWAPFIKKAPSVFLPDYFGWAGGISINLFIIILLYVIALRAEKGHAPSESTNYLKGAICLGLLSSIHIFVLKSPWAVSGAFYWIEDFFKNLFQGTAYSSLKHAPVTAYGSNIRNIGLLIGSLISILFSKRFSIKKIRSGKQVKNSVIGGLLMGYGICIAGGCNISSFFIAAASLSVSGWVFMIALFAGAFVGIKILYKTM